MFHIAYSVSNFWQQTFPFNCKFSFNCKASKRKERKEKRRKEKKKEKKKQRKGKLYVLACLLDSLMIFVLNVLVLKSTGILGSNEEHMKCHCCCCCCSSHCIHLFLLDIQHPETIIKLYRILATPIVGLFPA